MKTRSAHRMMADNLLGEYYASGNHSGNLYDKTRPEIKKRNIGHWNA
jgi:hypothetical protein